MNASVLRVIWQHERTVLSRNRILLTLSSLILLMLISSLWIGSSMLHKQQQTIARIGAYQSELTDSLKTRIERIRANGMVHPGFIWDDPTFAYNVARNEGPQYAVKQPFLLQALNVGQSDLQPFYYKVYITRKQYLVHEGEIENSFLQFIGNFDFAFVVIYLLPLLIIVFSYNVLSSEKEQGTWVLLKTSNQSIARMMLYRIGIRYVVFTGFFWAVVVPVLVLLIGSSFLLTLNWWWMVGFISVYIAFWFALSLLVNSFSWPSTINAMVLIFIWLTTGILVPNLLQIGLTQAYPIPSRISQTIDERNAINRYFERDGQLLTKDVFSNPRTMIRQASIVTPGMVYGYGVIVYKSQEIRDQATRIAEQKLYGQISQQQKTIGQWQLLSPALMMQEVMSALSGTHWHQFNQFSLDVDAFRWRVQRFFYVKMASEQTYRTFTVRDANQIPRFKPFIYNDYHWFSVGSMLSIYSAVVVALIAIGYIMMRKA